MKNSKGNSTKRLVLCAVLTAIVAVLQFMGAFIKFGPFSISLVLVPIVVGAAICGTGAGAWLGLAFGITVLLSGDAALFMAINIPGTIATVLLKGMLCGLAAGLVYKSLAGKNIYIAVIAAALVCPVVNTGIFLLGCKIFFMDTIREWAVQAEFGDNAGGYMIISLVGLNFIAETVINIVLSPIITRLIKMKSNFSY
ncbi:MAG: ECF transporter S component [Clostridia bacterium]|nr:ECF transporter S component [Clostridia bacterium]